MCDLKSFRKANNLTQSDIADFLGGGVGKAFISQIEHGNRKLPSAQLAKLLNNPYGWDTSMLTSDPSVVANAVNNSKASVNISGSGECDALRRENDLLRQQLAEEKARSAQYWDMICKLTQK